MQCRTPSPCPPTRMFPAARGRIRSARRKGIRSGMRRPKSRRSTETQGAISPQFLRGVALFNAGYYWEAHEVWEGLWHAYGRRGVLADVIKALIKLAAAGVKVREGQEHGVRIHARRAAELFASARSAGASHQLGLNLDEWAERLPKHRGSTAARSGACRYSGRAGLRVSDRDRSERFSTLITLNRGDSRGLSQW